MGWLKNLFKRKSTVDDEGFPLPDEDKGEVVIKFRLPDGKRLNIYAIDPKKVKKNENRV